MLLEQGADASVQAGKYGNVLQAATLRRHDKIVRMLLELGAFPTKERDRKCTQRHPRYMGGPQLMFMGT